MFSRQLKKLKKKKLIKDSGLREEKKGCQGFKTLNKRENFTVIKITIIFVYKSDK